MDLIEFFATLRQNTDLGVDSYECMSTKFPINYDWENAVRRRYDPDMEIMSLSSDILFDKSKVLDEWVSLSGQVGNASHALNVLLVKYGFRKSALLSTTKDKIEYYKKHCSIIERSTSPNTISFFAVHPDNEQQIREELSRETSEVGSVLGYPRVATDFFIQTIKGGNITSKNYGIVMNYKNLSTTRRGKVFIFVCGEIDVPYCTMYMNAILLKMVPLSKALNIEMSVTIRKPHDL